MAANAKLKLILELGNKLFNSKLMQTKRKLSTTTDKMRGKLKQLKLSGVDTFNALKSEIPLFGRAMELLGNPYTLLIAGLVSVGLLLGKASNEAKKFNHEFLQIKQLNLDKNNKDLKTYKGLIMDAAFETGQSLTNTTKAYYDIQSALGYYGKDAETIFKSVAKFSTATGAELNDSINATSKAIKAFGLSANQTDMLLASNAKTVQVGITTFRELAQVQTEYAGAAAGAGQKVDAANKLFAAFTSIAKDSRTAATLTKTAFQGLTQEATLKGLKSIGVELYNSQGNLKDIDVILRQVNGKFKNMSSKQIDALINKIGGPEGLRALFTKLKNGADDLFKTFESFDSSKFDLDKALKNAQGDVTVLGSIVKNRLNTVMAKLGEKILPLVAKALNVVNEVLIFLYKNGKPIYRLIKDLTIVFFAFKIQSLLLNGTIVKLAKTFGISLLNGIRNSATAMRSFTAAIKANAIGLIVSAIALLISKLGEARAELKKFKEDQLDKDKRFTNNVNEIASPTNIDKGLLKTSDLTKRQADEILQRTKSRLNELQDLRSKLSVQLQQGKGYNASNILRDHDELKTLLATKNRSQVQNNRIDQLKFNISEHTKELTKGFTIAKINALITRNKGILKHFGKKGVLEDDGKFKVDSTNSGSNSNDYGVNKVSSAASAPKSIVIDKIVFNQGGINTQNTTLAHKTPEEIEEWFNEAMMRVVRNAETS